MRSAILTFVLLLFGVWIAPDVALGSCEAEAADHEDACEDEGPCEDDEPCNDDCQTCSCCAARRSPTVASVASMHPPAETAGARSFSLFALPSSTEPAGIFHVPRSALV